MKVKPKNYLYSEIKFRDLHAYIYIREFKLMFLAKRFKYKTTLFCAYSHNALFILCIL